MGCDYIIDGGQTMNPSVEDFVKAVEQINADFVIIIPNNKNVMLSAQMAKDLIEDKSVHVLKAKTIAQGYSALTMFDATEDIDTNLSEMNGYIDNVKTGEVTYAIRDSKNNGVDIKKDHYMGIYNGQIIKSLPTRLEVTQALVEHMVEDTSEIMTIMYGKDVDEDEINQITAFVEEKYDLEVDVIEGGQDVYAYIISVE